MIIDIVGEDEVTRSIIERLINDYRKDIVIKERLPARGGQLKNFAPKYNALNTPVFLLTDLDNTECPPSLIKEWFQDSEINKTLLFRIAQEESETWLMADRKGFSKWLGVDIASIPESKIIDSEKKINEIIFPIKPSLYMMLKIANNSSKQELKESLTPRNGAKKGPGYNSAMVDFIKNHWDIEHASENSYSLRKAILRLSEFK